MWIGNFYRTSGMLLHTGALPLSPINLLGHLQPELLANDFFVANSGGKPNRFSFKPCSPKKNGPLRARKVMETNKPSARPTLSAIISEQVMDQVSADSKTWPRCSCLPASIPAGTTRAS